MNTAPAPGLMLVAHIESCACSPGGARIVASEADTVSRGGMTSPAHVFVVACAHDAAVAELTLITVVVAAIVVGTGKEAPPPDTFREDVCGWEKRSLSITSLELFAVSGMGVKGTVLSILVER